VLTLQDKVLLSSTQAIKLLCEQDDFLDNSPKNSDEENNVRSNKESNLISLVHYNDLFVVFVVFGTPNKYMHFI
jgi:hypothetical protein